ncbi:unnamed protein product [Amoebophrya sp. A120]|nr:unnamed protein product [Amoebophrya sp. A120]|eukprot:GSA120T00020101001.1
MNKRQNAGRVDLQAIPPLASSTIMGGGKKQARGVSPHQVVDDDQQTKRGKTHIPFCMLVLVFGLGTCVVLLIVVINCMYRKHGENLEKEKFVWSVAQKNDYDPQKRLDLYGDSNQLLPAGRQMLSYDAVFSHDERMISKEGNIFTFNDNGASPSSSTAHNV